MELGKLLEHMPLYSDATGTPIGAIDLYEGGLRAAVDDQTYMVPIDYVESITPERELALGKVQVKMVVYELMGMKHELRFIMSVVYLATLRKACGK
ncbi:MAG: hypothetical protein Q7T16_01725 [Candidatus Burarchaeum sp.]|nr:hypothetical protein [Candidatus Burarchaeum sp.]MDO8339354.1 hypothetical protein [Candidatus Burarchaeum sp.]